MMFSPGKLIILLVIAFLIFGDIPKYMKTFRSFIRKS